MLNDIRIISVTHWKCGNCFLHCMLDTVNGNPQQHYQYHPNRIFLFNTWYEKIDYDIDREIIIYKGM